MTDAPPLSRGAQALGLLLAAFFLALIAALIVLLSRPPVIETTENQASIFFTADRNLFSAGDCTTVRWDVEGIKEIYFNGQATTGSDNKTTCSALNRLRLVFTDDSIGEYELRLGIINRNPLLWLLLGSAALLLLGMFYMLISPAVTRFFGRSAARLWKLGIRTLLAVVLIGFLLELGARAYFNTVGTTREKVMYLYSAEEIRNLPSMEIALPYVNYIPAPNYEGNNRLGYRGPEVEIPKPDGVFRIAALGGSTTYGSATRAEDSYPAFLQQILREEYGYENVEVVNAGMIGYTTWDNLANYIFRVIELQPDLLIFYEGFNDVQPRTVDPECYRGLNPIRGLNPMRSLYQQVNLGPGSFSTLYRLLAIRFGWMQDPSTLTARFEGNPGGCPAPVFVPARVAENPPVYFERNLRSLIAVAHSNHTEVMFSTWTYRPTAGNESVPMEWRPAIEEHNNILRRLAAEFDLPLYDLAATDFAETLAYWAGEDPVHMSPVGTHEQASRYAAYLDEQGIIPR
jgi:lysophospholipase L1-like esterase